MLYNLRHTRSVRRSLSVDAAKTLNAFATNRIDYCGIAFSRATTSRLQQLQSALNVAARLIVQRKKYNPITATIRDMLHWLPMQQNEYKLCDIVFKAMHNTAFVIAGISD